ncbi:MAG: hypothetical protein M1480_10885 [Bacteroidetes bacterium]|nr:hypothetical protein [Bacteroidota bacterium]
MNSSIHATLGMGDLLNLTSQGLSPWQKHQASLDALTAWFLSRRPTHLCSTENTSR